MAIDSSIFGLRFRSNVDITPTLDELDQFLASPKIADTRVPRARDLERYHAMIERLQAFEARRHSVEEVPDIRDQMLYGVLGLTQFFSPGLELAVGQFKYHLNRLAAIDLKKPADFIQAAEREIAELDPKRKVQAAKSERLRAMVEERRQAIAVLMRERAELVEELVNIAQYVRENLVRIEHVCETSIVILVGFQVTKSTEKQFIAALKEQFKDQLAAARERGPISNQDLENAKRDFAAVSGAVAALIRDDVYTLTSLYEAVYEHVQCYAGAIEVLLARNKAGQDDLGLCTELEGVLDALVGDFRYELKAVAVSRETAYENVLREKRREILDNLFTKLDQDRRTRQDRRRHGDPRKYATPTSLASERRAAKERRSAKVRRRT
jgi:hypothetical protein